MKAPSTEQIPPAFKAPIAIRAPYRFEGPSDDFVTVTRGSTTPNYVDQTLVRPVPEELIPTTEYAPGKVMIDRVDTSFDDNSRQALIDHHAGTETLPTIRMPFALGIRAAVADRQARRAQERLESLAKRQKTLRYIGERVLKDKGHLLYTEAHIKPGDRRPEGVDRPHDAASRRAGNRLGRINIDRKNMAAAGGSRLVSYPGIAGKERQKPGKLFYDEYYKGPNGQIRRSLGERHAMGVAARKYRKFEKGAEAYDKKFNAIVTKPSRDANRLAQLRDKSILKAEAMRKLDESKKQKAEEKKAAKLLKKQGS